MNKPDPAHIRNLIEQLRQEASHAGSPAPADFAQRIVSGLPRQRSTALPRIVWSALAASLLLTGGMWIALAMRPAVEHRPRDIAKAAPQMPVVEIPGFPQAITQLDLTSGFTGEVAALRHDSQRVFGFFSEVGEPLRAAARLARDQPGQ